MQTKLHDVAVIPSLSHVHLFAYDVAVVPSLSHVHLFAYRALQHPWLPCLSLSPRVGSNSRPLSWWFYLTISSSVIPFSCLQSLLASRSFPVSQLFTPGGQSTGASALESVLPIKYSGLISFRIDWVALLAVQGTPKGLLQHHNLKVLILWHSAFFMVQLSHQYMTTGKNHSFD